MDASAGTVSLLRVLVALLLVLSKPVPVAVEEDNGELGCLLVHFELFSIRLPMSGGSTKPP
jgi:hypothetical protein